ncbi:TMV resistance protein N-like [Lotus japonicus]|uniref:TMV resistance protein N-like n=1 Tax=Lotus japonicus TaxID=34305 RepID=UPI0025881016|nr:TMV resistance protein N-like [Lotus japonicus]
MEDNRQIINFAPSSSSSVMPRKKYDVFLSFRGDDTRDNFISHLYDALKKEVETYIDYRLEKGDEISQALFNAIQDSHVSVVIFSENYASSKWCLDELTKILQCKRDHGQIVIPVFYKVDPSHVRKQTETYRKAFAKHEQDLNISDDDKLQKWRLALRDAANLAGWDSRNRNESDFIKDIVKDVLQKLNIRYPVELKGLVGIEEHYATVESLLKIGSIDEVRVIGIWGMGGIGKTTLAHALYAKLSIEFEGHCFLKNVREQSKKIGLDALRSTLFSELLREKILQVESHYVMRRLARKKVLIVFDDVATSEQLDDLISDYDSLAPGSRVIVTTRDKHIFSQVNEIYEVKELNNHDSLQLFCLNAFREKQPKIGYEELLESVIAYCKGNPLALKVLGARLRSRSKEAWQSEVRKLQKIPDVKIHNVLKLSFDGLDCTEQDIFLDIACFLKGNHRDGVTSLLDACGFFATAGIENLLDKSLITISEDNVIQMHDLIQEMGWEIVRQDSKDPGRRSRLWNPDEVYDVLKNNKGTEAVEGIVLDVFEIKDLPLSSNSFIKMSEMRILKFYSSRWSQECKIYLPNGLDALSDKLRLLEWPGYCLESLPSTFCAEKLVKLVMRRSNLKKLWNGVLIYSLRYNVTDVKFLMLGLVLAIKKLYISRLFCRLEDHLIGFLCQILRNYRLYKSEVVAKSYKGVHSFRNIRKIYEVTYDTFKDACYTMNLLEDDKEYIDEVIEALHLVVNLKEIDLTCSKDLVELPDLTHATNLEVLRLEECISLREVHPSILSLPKLESLNLQGCTKIECLETEVHSKSLRIIHLHNCSSLKKFSVFSKKLEELWLDCTVIQELPSSIWRCEKLESLWLMGCDNLESFGIESKSSHDPVNASLQILDLSGCKLVNESNLCLILDGVRSLSDLYLEDCCNLRALPDSIGSLTSLVELHLSGNNNVEMLSPNIKNLLKLKSLYLVNCRKLVSLPDLPPSLKRLSAVNCTSLETKFSTQLLSVVNTDDRGGYVMVPGSQVPDMFMFRGEGDSITFPQLPNSRNICRFTCCIILPYLPQSRGTLRYRINKHPTLYDDGFLLFCPYGDTSISDHLVLFSIPIDRFDSLECDPNNITFEFGHLYSNDTIEIKRCGVIPVYASQYQQQLTIPIEQCGSKRKAPSFKKEESSRPEKHIIPFDTPSASNNDLNQTIEVSEGKDLSNNQVDNCSELVLFAKSHTLMEIDNPDWDPIGEVDSILSDSYKVSPMSTHSTCISEPNAKVILAKLETLLETSLEIISSNDEVKQQFHHVLEQLGRFEAEVPVRLHPVICKLKTLIEGFDFRFATSQKTIQDYDQLLQSRSSMTDQLRSVKVQQDQIKAKVTELKMKIENINSEIGEQEKESSVLDEAREKLKRELDHYDAESSKLKIQVAQWVPECKTIFTDLKNSEPDYKVAVTNIKKYEDEWALVKKNFVANEF